MAHKITARCIVCADGGANELDNLHLAGEEETICVCSWRFCYWLHC